MRGYPRARRIPRSASLQVNSSHGRRDAPFCSVDGAVPEGAGAGDLPGLHETHPGAGGKPVAVTHLDALLGGQRDVEGVDASDTVCESGPGSLFDRAGLDRLAAHQGGQVAKRRGDINAGDRAVRRGLRTSAIRSTGCSSLRPAPRP